MHRMHALLPRTRAARRRDAVLARLVDEVEVEAGRTLARQGGLAAEFFVIRSGAATVLRDGVPVAELGPGDHFGEIGLLHGPWRTASVVASTPMELGVLAPRQFRALLASDPELGSAIRVSAAARLARDGAGEEGR